MRVTVFENTMMFFAELDLILRPRYAGIRKSS
jgi:hypothetical protein